MTGYYASTLMRYGVAIAVLRLLTAELFAATRRCYACRPPLTFTRHHEG